MILRAPFRLPVGIQNIWTDPLVAGADRLMFGDETRHACQKPLSHARRIVEASSRPADLIFEPFGGTCRIAVACEGIAKLHPEEARRYLCVEMDEDGREYIAAVLAQLGRGETGSAAAGQVPLFGAPR